MIQGLGKQSGVPDLLQDFQVQQLFKMRSQNWGGQKLKNSKSLEKLLGGPQRFSSRLRVQKPAKMIMGCVLCLSVQNGIEMVDYIKW